MACGEHTRAAIDGRTEVVPGPLLRLAAVNGDADMQVGPRRPLLGCQLSLDVQGAARGVARPREDGQDAVALTARLHLHAAVGADGSAQHGVVYSHRLAHL